MSLVPHVFVRRDVAVQARHPGLSKTPGLSRRSHRGCLFAVTYAVPKPDTSAGDLRFFEMLRLLALRYDVDLWICRAEGQISDAERSRYEKQLKSHGISVYSSTTPLSALLAAKCYDAALFEMYWVAEEVAPLFRLAQPHAAVVIDSVDVAFSREELAQRVGLCEARQVAETKRRELASYRAADAVIVVSEADRDLLVKEIPGLSTAVVRIIMQTHDTALHLESKRLIFVGAFLWPPNEDGIAWFIREIWPIVRREEPAATVHIIGSHPTATVTELSREPGVVLHGYVVDTRPHLKQAAVSVAPLRYGGGMKGKITEAMAVGLPVVTTHVGAQGFNAADGHELLIRDDPESFAKAVLQLLANTAERVRIGNGGRALTARLCSPEHAQAALYALFDPMIVPRRRFAAGWVVYRIAYAMRKTILKIIPGALVRTSTR